MQLFSLKKITSKSFVIIGKLAYLVMRRRSRKLGEPRLLGIEGDLDERLHKTQTHNVKKTINKATRDYYFISKHFSID